MIYYVFRKDDGAYMGSGITMFDDAIYGSTTIPTPSMEDGQIASWNGNAWVIQQEDAQ